jgi:hypothetical protein
MPTWENWNINTIGFKAYGELSQVMKSIAVNPLEPLKR